MTGTTSQATGNPDGTEPAAAQTLAGRVRHSFVDSSGSIVFGMEDGTVSIFGLVFGVAAAAPDSRAVLLAGATGAISAAVSMMAGTFLDVSTERDRTRAAIAMEQREIAEKPAEEAEEVRARLMQAGFNSND